MEDYPAVICVESQLPLECGCVRCGKSTRHKYALDTTPESDLKAEAIVSNVLLLVPFGGLLTVAMGLKKHHVKVPFCGLCHIKHFLPEPRLTILIIGVIATITYTIYRGISGDVPGVFIGIGLMIISLGVVVYANRYSEVRRLPLAIERIEERYYYYFYPSGRYFEWARRIEAEQGVASGR